jgi:hypothetical protein
LKPVDEDRLIEAVQRWKKIGIRKEKGTQKHYCITRQSGKPGRNEVMFADPEGVHSIKTG